MFLQNFPEKPDVTVVVDHVIVDLGYAGNPHNYDPPRDDHIIDMIKLTEPVRLVYTLVQF